MLPAPAPWQITLARLEGALPFIDPPLSQAWALASLRRLWQVHVRDYPFENVGIAHDGGVDATELMRSWHAEERAAFLGWIARHAPPALAGAASCVAAAKGIAVRPDAAFAAADSALTRLDGLPVGSAPQHALMDWLRALREEESHFLEGGSEPRLVGGLSVTRTAPRGAAWAASLALAVRPHIFGLGRAPFALAGLAPRRLFRAEPEQPLAQLLAEAIAVAAQNARDDLARLRTGLRLGAERLSGRYTSSRSSDAWRLLLALGPLTRAEIGRALQVTPRTASQAVIALEAAGLATYRAGEHAVLPAATGSAAPPERLAPLPSPVLATIEAAIAHADQLLERYSNPSEAVDNVRT